MKKLLAALFTLALALSIAAPVFAQDAGSQDSSAPAQSDSSMKKEKKMKKSHMKKERKMKKDKMEKKADDTSTPPQK